MSLRQAMILEKAGLIENSVKTTKHSEAGVFSRRNISAALGETRTPDLMVRRHDLSKGSVCMLSGQLLLPDFSMY
jgi:hypothetical protein